MATKTKNAPALNLDSFTTVVPKATKSTDKKEVVMTEGAIAKMIDQYQEAKEAKEAAEGRLKEAEVVVKEAGRKHAIKTMFAQGKDFASFILSSASNGLLYIVQDRFKMITAENVDLVRSIVGEENVVKETKYILNPDVLAKHQEKIARAIQALDLPAEDKSALLLGQHSYRYTFDLNDIGRIAKERRTSVDQIFEATVPVQQLKTRAEK
jgi:hypothetical protein